MSGGIRQVHRWATILFTLAFLANVVALTIGHGRQPAAAITYSPLLPLFVLLLTGLYMFFLPHAARWRRSATR